MYAEYLRGCSYATIDVANGRDALVAVLAHHPDVIVTEARLPHLDGYELCRVVRGNHSVAHTPVLFVTADGFQQDVQRARAAGATAVLVKPCLPTQLASAIRDIIRRERSIPPRAHST
jgi:CheY-like chemotaxis protein